MKFLLRLTATLYAVCGWVLAQEPQLHVQPLKKLTSPPAQCWILDEANGPTTIRVDYKYDGASFREVMPKGSGPDFGWVSVPKDFTVTDRVLVRRNGRDFCEISYRVKDPGSPLAFLTVLLLREDKDGWWTPVLVAYSEEGLYDSKLISNSKWPLALVVDMSVSGTGGMGARHLFDISGAKPRLAVTADRHNVKAADYPDSTERDREQILRRIRLEMARANGD